MNKLGIITCGLFGFGIGFVVVAACGTDRRSGFDERAGFPTEGQGAGFGDGGAEGGATKKLDRDPISCDEARDFRTYVGCDYWPTVTANIVQDVFDFAVAVANTGAAPANITVTGNGVNETTTVAPGALGIIHLPWVAALKGNFTGLSQSVLAKGGAYHLVSDRPVVVYQFSPLEFKAAGPPGKNWSACMKQIGAPDCYSYTNDASLLIPSTAMTGAYRIMGTYGWSRHPMNEQGKFDPTQPLQPGYAPFFTITATQNGTHVTVKLGSKAKVVAGGGIAGADANGTVTLTLDAGDVAEIVGGLGRDYDFSGSLLNADKPVQVITGVPCQDYPLDTHACDHVEETVFPAETLGKHYVVTTPTGPKANKVGHYVRFYGNANETKLTYKGPKPNGAPDSLSEGQVVECEAQADFEVEGDKAFGVGMFMLGGELVDPSYGGSGQPQGDPSQSFAVTVEQYRKKYVFLAPADYKTSYVDVVMESGTKLTLDGKDVSALAATITGTGWMVGRLLLEPTNGGVHTLDADRPVGIQVLGYGDNTTYQYPGGLNLGEITPRPEIPK